jgi:hypothetical protein
MTLNSSFVVRVEKQPELSFGDIMNRIRTWLDHHKIEPISFVPYPTPLVELGLRSRSTARTRRTFFKREFA